MAYFNMDNMIVLVKKLRVLILKIRENIV